MDAEAFMEVTGLAADTFWKGEMEIRGTVTDGSSQYRVRILRKGSQVFDYSCSRMDLSGKRLGICSEGCKSGTKEVELCPHAKALMEAFLKQEDQKFLKPVSTSPRVRFMVREYTNREVSRIMGDEEENTICLVPRLKLSRMEIQLQFFIGKDKLYPVKDLVTFSQAVEFERFMEYGKNFSFHHNLAAFRMECRPLVLLVMEMVGIYREHYSQMHKSAWGSEPVLKELTLGKAARNRFFAIMEGQTLECEGPWKEKRMLTIRRGDPKFTVQVERSGRDGVRLKLPDRLLAYQGEKCLFVADMENLFCCDEEYTRDLTVLLEYTVMGQDPEYEILINDRDMPLFYERVLHRLELHRLLSTKELELEEYRPKELRASFYFDSNGAEEVSMRPELSYGDFSFHPMDDENVPKEICRDVPGEFKVSQVITKYFKFTGEGSREMVIRGDDEAIYRLMSEGMPRFMELGEVFVSEAFKKIRVLPPVNVAVRVKSNGSWLDLDVDTEGIPKDELSALLKRYEAKKKFYRMKNGDFLTLGDGGLWTMSRLSGLLGVEKELAASETIRLPMYRAMLLDSVLKEDRSVEFYRDQLFKAVVRGMKNVEDSEFEIPAALTSVLRGYQTVGYRWLRSLDAYGFGGILADEMGLGKTVQVIALLLDEKKRSGKTSLIVCPASLVYNWESEIANFAPELSVCTVAGSQSEREAVLQELFDSETCQKDVVITSYDLLRRDLLYYAEYEFRFQIIDEAQYIKNASTQTSKAVKAIRARTRFALTGTPIENHLGELWSIFDFLMPGFLLTAAKFRKNFEIPIVRDGDKDALNRLHRMTGPFLLRRLKKDVLKELPDKMETVLFSQMEGEQKRLYTANAAALKTRLLEEGDALPGNEQIRILAELMKLRQICCEPSLCFSKYKGGSAKLETCMELLENGTQAGHKILLFSQFTSMLDVIAQRLKKQKIDYYMLTGATAKRERMQMVSDFQKNEVKVFLISLKAGGTGLNLTAADVVIHYDPWWNVAAQNQATDRAHRIGQKNQVTVFKLITKHTIEENILHLQEMKKELADTVVTEGTGAFSGITREDILAMLEE